MLPKFFMSQLSENGNTGHTGLAWGGRARVQGPPATLAAERSVSQLPVTHLQSPEEAFEHSVETLTDDEWEVWLKGSGDW